MFSRQIRDESEKNMPLWKEKSRHWVIFRVVRRCRHAGGGEGRPLKGERGGRDYIHLRPRYVLQSRFRLEIVRSGALVTGSSQRRRLLFVRCARCMGKRTFSLTINPVNCPIFPPTATAPPLLFPPRATYITHQNKMSPKSAKAIDTRGRCTSSKISPLEKSENSPRNISR